MGSVQLQGRFGLYLPNFPHSNHLLRRQSTLVLGVILLVHAFVIVLAFNDREKPQKSVPEKILLLINVLPKPEEASSTLPELEVKPFQLPYLSHPSIQIAEPVMSPLDIPINDSSYELPSKTSGQYENVFDPKVRQKLLDAQNLNKPRSKESVGSWTESDGRVFTYIGDGMCFVSMPKVDARDRGTNWGMTKCGKNDSEKAMDRVMADFESRKAPLGKLKSSP